MSHAMVKNNKPMYTVKHSFNTEISVSIRDGFLLSSKFAQFFYLDRELILDNMALSIPHNNVTSRFLSYGTGI